MMKFTARTQDMQHAMANACMVALKDKGAELLPGQELFECVQISKASKDTIRVSATNGQHSIDQVVHAAKITGSSLIAIPAHRLQKAFNALTDESMTVEAKELELRITTKRSKLKLPMLSGHMPKIPTPGEDTEFVKVDTDSFCLMIDASAYAAKRSGDDRSHCMGVHLKGKLDLVYACATDGHRMGYSEYNVGDTSLCMPFEEIWVPFRAMDLARKHVVGAEQFRLAVERGERGSTIFFSTNGAVFSAKLVDETAIDPHQVIPKDGATFDVDAKALSGAIKRICSIHDDPNIVLDVRGDTIMINAVSFGLRPTESKTEFPALTAVEDEVKICTRGPYLCDALSSIDGVATVSITGELEPMKITNASKTTIAIVMPVRQ